MGSPIPLCFPTDAFHPPPTCCIRKGERGGRRHTSEKHSRQDVSPPPPPPHLLETVGPGEEGGGGREDDYCRRSHDEKKKKEEIFFGGRETTNLGRTYRTRRWDGGGDTASSSFSKPGPHLMRGNSPLFQPELYSTKVGPPLGTVTGGKGGSALFL